MPLYTISELLTVCKEDMQIKDVTLPVDDKALIQRIQQSALKDFSVLYPRIVNAIITSAEAIDMSHRSTMGYVEYIIPEKYYHGSMILDVIRITASGYGSQAEMYMPTLLLGSAADMLETISEIKMAASLGSQMVHAPTHWFEHPNKLRVYNGWTTGSLMVELALMHDLSLSTIPPGAFMDFRKLVTLDLEEYLYGKMKRITDLETGVGSVQLKIDDWADAGREKKDLLREWAETTQFDMASINYF